MAAVRARGPLPVGSMQWINDENAQVERHCEQEMEDFGFSARNELEWLDEHMADIFAKENINVAEIFKTPGKLRGKTPRTARKRDPLQARIPLSDVFSTNVESHPPPIFGLKGRSPEKSTPTYTVAQDVVEVPAVRPQKKLNTDSGYHGLTEDEMDIDQPQPSGDVFGAKIIAQNSPLRAQINTIEQSEDRSTTERSFHSAREEITKTQVLDPAPQPHEPAVALNSKESPVLAKETDTMEMNMEGVEMEIEEHQIVNESRSPSQGSSPERPLVRKSSLTFAALPARPPLTTKKSFGARNSRTSQLEQSTFLGRFTGGKSLGGAKQTDPPEKELDDDMQAQIEKPPLLREESDPDVKITKLHNKSSTQRLHERIHLLGKSQTARPTKSIQALASGAQANYPQLPDSEVQPQKPQTATVQKQNDEDDDDWIQPPKSMAPPSSRPPLSKSISTDVMEGIRGKQTIGDQDFDLHSRERSASKPESPRPQTTKIADLRTASDSRAASPGIYSAYDGVKTYNDTEAVESAQSRYYAASTTPHGSPSAKRYVDGPLSASKSKLQSIMKTAKGLFSSSAGVSAQAKLDLEQAQESSNWQVIESPAADSALPSKVEDTDVRKTRSSTEKEERKRLQGLGAQSTRQQNKTQPNGLQAPKKPHGDESKTPSGTSSTVQPNTKTVRTSPRKTQNKEASEVFAHPEQPSQSMPPPTSQAQDRGLQSQRSKDPRRPIKPVKDAGPKPKPQPVAIRVGTLSSTQRMPLSNAALASSLQESLPPPQPKQPAVAKKPSLQPSASNSSLKSSVNGAAKPKALIVAERKKEQDEKEAQRKREQKAEADRRRAAQQEEARRQEQLHRQEIEKQRERERSAAAEDPKKLEQKRAIEQRRMQLQKKDQQRAAANNPTSTMRPELGGARPPSRQQNVPDHHSRPISNHATNPSKAPIKRVFDPENDEPQARPKAQAGPSYQQNEAKRRRTDDEEAEEFPMRPTHAPPVRQSAIRKDGPKPSAYVNSHVQAPPPAPHHNTGPSLMKSTTQAQAYQQHTHQQQISRPGNHPDMKQFATAKIPFADAPNPPAHHYNPAQQIHKTPHNQSSKFPLPPTAKSSPQYPNGENIHLEDIPSDSESDSSSPPSPNNSKPSLPEWAQSPNLRNLLMHQEEDINPDVVFGPVQSPHMEEMFRERHHRFRSRTSSANWTGQDRLTEEEIRRDREGRERVRKEGGWSFGLAP